MGDVGSLLLVLAAIYLSECVVWVRRGGVAFGQWWGKTWNLWQPGLLTGNQHGSLMLANPLPPLGCVFLGQPVPLSISPEAAFAYSAACLNPGWRPWQPGRYVRIADFKAVEVEGKKVLVNGKEFLKAASPGAARALAAWLREIKSLPVGERGVAIRRRLSEGLDTEKIAARLEEFRRRAKPIRLLSSGLFFYLFLVAPMLAWRFGLGHLGWALAALLLAQTITIAFLFRRAHQALYPGASDERFVPFLTMLLAPPTAIRAPDLLARPLLLPFHPLAISRVVCRPEVFKEFARQVLRDLQFPVLPVCPTNASGPVEAEQWYRAALLEAVEKFVGRTGLDVAELVAPPMPTEREIMAYCPRCGAQFVTAAGTCGDCGGRPLKSFNPGVELKA